MLMLFWDASWYLTEVWIVLMPFVLLYATIRWLVDKWKGGN